NPTYRSAIALSYKTWEEGDKMPDFILEITSKSTASEDRGIKKGLYAYLGVKEYFQYDPSADYLKPCSQGFRLMEGNYLPILGQLNGDRLSIYAETLGLELRLEANGEMRFYDPKTGEKLLSTREMEQARIQAEKRVSQLAAKLRELGFDPDLL
ncbi:MAG: Uma2 family endonuclease, partial [Snowella sp.]